MAIEEREISQFTLSISLMQNINGKITPKLFNRNQKMPIGIITSQLKLFVKMLEEDYYPSFKDGVSTINIDPEE